MFSCPNCGGKIVFDIDTQRPLCQYCGSQFRIEDLGPGIAQNVTTYEANVFVCRNCGAEVTSPDNQIVSFCSYCGSESVLYSRTVTADSPQTVLPFRLSKKKIHEMYATRLQNVWYLPKEFKDPQYIDSMRGIYMPFWSTSVSYPPQVRLNMHQRVDVSSDTYRIDTYSGIFYVTGTAERYLTDASSALDDAITDQLLPYPESSAKPFHPAYLAGFYADKSDVPVQKYTQYIQEKASEDAIEGIKQRLGTNFTIDSTILPNGQKVAPSVPATPKDYHATLMPVWFLTRRDKDRVSYGVVNGYTGSTYMDLPVDQKKFWPVTLAIALVLFIALSLFFSAVAKTALTISLLATALMMLVYQGELRNVMERETHLFDIGSATYDPKNGTSVKKKAKKTNTTFTTFFAMMVVMFVAMVFSDPTIMRFILGTAAIVLGTINVIKIIRDGSKVADKMLMVTGILSYATIVVGTLVQLAAPVYDYWYYGASLICLVGALLPGIMMIRCYNLSASRPLPNYFSREGGMNDAQ